MTPRTRSGGATPASSIVYKSTPRLKQARFRPQRKKVRTYGRRSRKSTTAGGGEGAEDEEEAETSANTTPNLKQKTLTQYDFGSSFNEESVVVLSDASDVENLEKIEDTDEAEKENIGPSSSARRSKPSTTKKRAPLGRIIDRAPEQDENDEPRVPDTEDEEDEGGDESPIVRKRRRVGFTEAERTKRRRTLGEEHRMSTMRESKSARRRTLGDSPLAGSSKSRYHTQTLTQFIGRTTSFVADSDDEELGGTENDGFLEWLGGGDGDGEEPASPSMGTQASKRGINAMTAASVPALPEDHSPSPQRRTRRRPAASQTGGQPSREESVVPQTPVKSIRFDLPSSAQRMSPSPSRLAAVYGAPNPYASPSSKRAGRRGSPLKPLTELTGKPTKRTSSPVTKPELVIEDSYATEGFSSVGGTQLRHATPSQTQMEVFSTPAEEMTTSTSAAAPSTQMDQVAGSVEQQEQQQSLPAPQPTQTQDGQNEQFYGALSQQIAEDDDPTSQQPLPVTPKAATRSINTVAAAMPADEREIPDSDEDDSDFGGDSDDVGVEGKKEEEEEDESHFAAGAETQLLMDQLQSSVRKWSGTPRRVGIAPSSSSVASPYPPRTSSPVASLGSAITPQSAPPSSMKPPSTAQPQKKQQHQPGTTAHDIPVQRRRGSAPLRKPLHHPEPMDTQGLPLESQRVALATLQGFTPASARTDILLPLSEAGLANLLSGHQDAVVLPFKVPAQVVRFWLVHDEVLRYLACVTPLEDGACNYDPKQDNGAGGRGTWTYHVGQVYELNNPVQEEDMRAEDWIHGHVGRYAYFPPAVVSQLLWNLRQAIFAEPGEDDAAAATTPSAAAAALAVPFSSSSPLQRSSKRSTPARRSSSRRRVLPPSSPLYTRPPASTMPAPPPPSRPGRASKNHTQPQPQPQPQPPLVRPSQATTASQASTVADGALASSSRPATRAGDDSSESLVFDDHGGSSIPMPYSSVVLSGLANLETSQLLTKSQTLPDSLMRDEDEDGEGFGGEQQGRTTADEIWDSEDE